MATDTQPSIPLSVSISLMIERRISMDRKKLFPILIVVILLLFTGCVGNNGQHETTLPLETTIPVETMPPPETTEPEDTTQPTPSIPTLEDHPYHDAFLRDGFIHIQGTPMLDRYGEADFDLVYYLYTGDSPVVELAALDMTLNIPEDWLDRVYIIQNVNIINESHYAYAYIVNREILDGYRDYADAEEMLFGLPDYMLHLYTYEIDESDGDLLDRYRSDEWYLGETEDRVCFVSFSNGGENLPQILIDVIGQDAYDDMVGDLIITREDLDDLVTIHNEIESIE